MMVKSAVLIAVLMVAVQISESRKLDRCCKTGGTLRHADETLECIPALMANTLNIRTAELAITPEKANAISDKEIIANHSHDYVCFDVVFDERSGLVMHTMIKINDKAPANRGLRRN